MYGSGTGGVDRRARELAQIFAEQSVLAIHNARLCHGERQAASSRSSSPGWTEPSDTSEADVAAARLTHLVVPALLGWSIVTLLSADGQLATSPGVSRPARRDRSGRLRRRPRRSDRTRLPTGRDHRIRSANGDSRPHVGSADAFVTGAHEAAPRWRPCRPVQPSGAASVSFSCRCGADGRTTTLARSHDQADGTVPEDVAGHPVD